MRRVNRLAAVLLTLLTMLLLFACQSLPTNIIPPPTPTPTPAPTEEPMAELEPTSTPVEPPVTIQVGRNETLGEFLVGPIGMPLYFSTRDEPGKSTCYNGCAEVWPPLLTQDGEEPVAGAGVAGELGVIARDDGGLQVTHNDMPLYSYVKDDQPDDPTGHGVAGVWYVRLNLPRQVPAGREAEGMPVTGLQIGGQAQLTPGAHGLRMHAAPGTDAPVVAHARPGDVLRVVEGPQMVDDTAWYIILNERSGIEGWVDGRYLMPYRGTSLPVGGQAELAPGVRGLYIRAGAGLDSPVIGEVRFEDVVEIEDGPQVVDESNWYEIVNHRSGVRGWVNGYYLIPLPNS